MKEVLFLVNLYCNVFKLEGIECLRFVYVRKLIFFILFFIVLKDFMLLRFNKRLLIV